MHAHLEHIVGVELGAAQLVPLENMPRQQQLAYAICVQLDTTTHSRGRLTAHICAQQGQIQVVDDQAAHFAQQEATHPRLDLAHAFCVKQENTHLQQGLITASGVELEVM